MKTVIEALADLGEAAGPNGLIDITVSNDQGVKHTISVKGGYVSVATEPLYARALMVLCQEFTDKQG